MKKTVVIHQPDFMPYLGFFHRFLHADLFIALDHVQFVQGTSRAWMNRDKIKTAQGEKWLTVSVKKAPHGTSINRIQLSSDVDWRKDNLHLLEQNYRAASWYSEVIPHIQSLYQQPFDMLRDFNIASIEMLMELLEVRIPWIWSSELDPVGSKNEMLVDLLQKVGATHYLSGTGARVYMQPEKFEEAGVKVIWQDFIHPVYTQQYGEFVPYLSALDLLFNHGVAGSRKLVRMMDK